MVSLNFMINEAYKITRREVYPAVDSWKNRHSIEITLRFPR
jgi:hypothetical protein